MNKYKCRVCDSELSYVKNIRGEENNKPIGLYKCKKCKSYFTRVDYKKINSSELLHGSVEDYPDQNTAAYRINNLFSMADKKGFVSSQSNRFLDIGCGVGWSLTVAEKRGYKAFGVEPVVEASEYANQTLKLNVTNDYFKPGMFDNESFDVIVIDQVLEHLPDPVDFIGNAISLLKPDGVLFLAVPPVDWSRRVLSASLILPTHLCNRIFSDNDSNISRAIEKYDTFHYPEGHINYFTKKSIMLLADKYDCAVVDELYSNRLRSKYFPFFNLTTGSYIIRKKTHLDNKIKIPSSK